MNTQGADHNERQKAEFLRLAEAYRTNPELFRRETHVEDAATLREFGIFIPHKEKFSAGYLKFLPQDFIVEELTSTGKQCTVEHEHVLDDSTSLPESPTIYATLVKCGQSTIQSVEDIARQLGIDRSRIGYAGIKDKDAITAQRVSFRNVTLSNLKKVKSDSYFLKEVEAGKGVVNKGELKGNRFTILIRTDKSFFDAEQSKLFIEQLTHVKTDGFYNFYYLQRFGTPRLINFFWGLDILRGNYKKVIESYLTDTRGNELSYFKGLRKEAAANLGDLQKVRDIFAQYSFTFNNELSLIDHLIAFPGQYKEALVKIQEQSTLWIYGLSSLLFNEKISSYLERGMEPPMELPLLLSDRKEDVEVYEDSLKSLGIFPPPFHNLRAFPFIRLQKRMTPTKKFVDFKKAEIVPQGVILSFVLDKGEYATTFVSHLFNLIGDKVPEGIPEESVATKEMIGEGSIEKTIERFATVIVSKKENRLETAGEE